MLAFKWRAMLGPSKATQSVQATHDLSHPLFAGAFGSYIPDVASITGKETGSKCTFDRA
jgi:hypothetical protein